MSDTPAVQELEAQIRNREIIIKSLLVARAVDELLGADLDAANGVEEKLLAAGYERAARGDWFLF